MKIEIKTKSYYDTLTVKKNETDYGYNVNFTPSSSNCKLVTLDSISGLLDAFKNDEDRINILKEFMKARPNQNVFLTVVKKEHAEWFKKNFTLYYYNEVPCGYSNGLQYHILIKNHPDQRKPIENVTIVKEKVDKTKIINIINNAFNTTINRTNRLKLIEEGIDALNNQ